MELTPRQKQLIALVVAMNAVVDRLCIFAGILLLISGVPRFASLPPGCRTNRQAVPRPFAGVNIVRDVLYNLSDKLFRSRMRINKWVFSYIVDHFKKLELWAGHDFARYGTLGPDQVLAIGLDRLSGGASFEVVGRLNFVSKQGAWAAFQMFVWAIKRALQPKFVRWPNSTARREALEEGFRSLKGIPGIIGSIDGSHIPIMRPVKYGDAEFFNRKGWASVLLQGICSATGVFWDYHCGWAGSLHDYNLFKKTPAGKRVMAGDLGGYMLVGDAAYPPRPYMLSPFEESAAGLTRELRSFNYYVSVTRMPIERAFGGLKVRWRILMGRVHADLNRIPDLVGCCITLHNICELMDGPVLRGEVEEAMRAGRAMGHEFFKNWHQRNIEACMLPIEEELAGLEQGGFMEDSEEESEGGTEEAVPSVNLNAQDKVGYKYREWLVPHVLRFNEERQE